MIPHARIFAFAAIISALSAGCWSKREALTRCRAQDQTVCTSPNRALVCDAEKWIDRPCRGPNGCARRGDVDDCDDTLALEGDRCPSSPPLDYACTVDRSQALVCNGGQFRLWRNCRGEGHCKIDGSRHLTCDTTLGESSDPCEKEGTFSCAVDMQSMLVCRDRSLAIASSCRGPKGCGFDRESYQVKCDDAVAVEGEACDRANRITCSAINGAELVCEGGRYIKRRDCLRVACHIENSELFCD